MSTLINDSIDDAMIVSILAENGKISLRKVSAKVGMSYSSLRWKMRKLEDCGLMTLKPLVQASLYGSIAAFIEIEVESSQEELAKRMYKCNRVLAAVVVNNKVYAIALAKSVNQIHLLLDELTSTAKVKSYTVRYGSIPGEAMVPIKSGGGCKNCIVREAYGEMACMPTLRK
ncbi:MAG: winged helix-turn-helix transcriptional regulator [Desulfurococcaceae archaeon]